MRKLLPAALAALALLGACVSLTQDQRYSRDIVGSWIVAGDSPDYRPVPMHERFYKDGTARIFWFADSTCTRITGETHLQWRIVGGVLVTTITKVSDKKFGHVGDVLKARIVSLTGDRMVLHSLDDGSTFARKRSTGCLAPKLETI